MTQRWRRALTFAAVFFAANLAVDAYRAGGLTAGALASTTLLTLAVTAAYVALTALIYRRKDRP